MVDAQAAAVASVGYQVDQQEHTGMRHGAWIDSIVSQSAEDDVFLILDIDCIPMRSETVSSAFDRASSGAIVGIAQAANHTPTPDFLYAGPPFLAFSKKTWKKVGEPSFNDSPEFDVAGRFSHDAQSADVDLNLLFPWFVGDPKWALADKGCFGVGTFYDTGVFHLFEARRSHSVESFCYVADCVTTGARIDYVRLSRMVRHQSPRERLKAWLGR